MGTLTNIFGNTIKKKKIKKGKCIFPYKITLKQKTSTTKKISQPKVVNECSPSIPIKKTNGSILEADGIFCPTKVKGIYDKTENYNSRKKHTLWKQDKRNSKPYYLYEENKDLTPKGFCDMREYIQRQKSKTLKDKKINPKCIPKFKTKKTMETTIPTNYTENGTDYTCIVEDNLDKIKDKFIPQLICPLELDKDGVYDRVKNKNTGPCFI
jgi:hypothetical protein